MADWSPQQYKRFEAERTQPAIDLCRRIPLKTARKIVDLGCGPGNSTAVLARHFPKADILGVDSSQAMLAEAEKALPACRFAHFDLAGGFDALGEGYDIGFSNACFQWVPDHPALLKKAMSLLRSGGVLAAQVPMNQDEPIKQCLDALVAQAPWRGWIHTPRPFHTLRPEQYYDLLQALSEEVDLWQTSYYHVLGSVEDMLEWYRATGLRPYLQALPAEERAGFEQALLQQLRKAYLPQQDGRILFRFPRFFFMAVRP